MLEHLTTRPSQTAAVARRFAGALSSLPLHIHLRGELGAGKTLWARALIKALGGTNAPSPSFPMAISHTPAAMTVHHLDLFRLPQGSLLPEDLLELTQEDALCLVEWPERAADLPSADILLSFEFITDGRRLSFDAKSARGGECLSAFLR